MYVCMYVYIVFSGSLSTLSVSFGNSPDAVT